jgi:hypothetical protein
LKIGFEYIHLTSILKINTNTDIHIKVFLSDTNADNPATYTCFDEPHDPTHSRGGDSWSSWTPRQQRARAARFGQTFPSLPASAVPLLPPPRPHRTRALARAPGPRTRGHPHSFGDLGEPAAGAGTAGGVRSWTRSTDGPTYHIPSTFLSPFPAAAGCDQIPPILSPAPRPRSRDSIPSSHPCQNRSKPRRKRRKSDSAPPPVPDLSRGSFDAAPIFSLPECISIFMSFPVLLLPRLLNWVGRLLSVGADCLEILVGGSGSKREGCPRLRWAHLRCGACLSLLLGSVQSKVG